MITVKMTIAMAVNNRMRKMSTHVRLLMSPMAFRDTEMLGDRSSGLSEDSEMRVLYLDRSTGRR